MKKSTLFSSDEGRKVEVEERDLLTLLREEESSQKRFNLMDKLVRLVDSLWANKPGYQLLTSENEFNALKKALLRSTFYCSRIPMYRSWIPKPNKPGKLRAITQPNKADRVVMGALSLLLNIVYEDVFLPNSHGFCYSKRSRAYYFLSTSTEMEIRG